MNVVAMGSLSVFERDGVYQIYVTDIIPDGVGSVYIANQQLREKLRKEGISKGFKVVFSEELPDRNAIIPMEERNKKSQVGTISYLPASFGIVCAQVAITSILSL